MSSGGVAIHMAHAHGPLSRTNTAPVFSARSAGLSQTMSHSSRSSQLSGSTAFTSSSSTSLSSLASSATMVPPPASGNVIATNNIINQRADASRSLYQICVNLRQRLAQVPGFDVHLNDSIHEDEGDLEMDPVSSIWRCLRKGTPLLTIYNAIRPPTPLHVDEHEKSDKRPKRAAFNFVRECLQGELQIPPGECFAISDLFGDDTTGFVKVTQVINLVLDVAQQRGQLLTVEEEKLDPASMSVSEKMSYRDHVVAELVNTERKYVQDLENLHDLKKQIEQKGVVPGNVVHEIFLNINAILDFQRRFLIKIETTNSLPQTQQKWGLPFVNYEESFNIYKPFIANQRKAAALAKRDFVKLSEAKHAIVVDFNTLDGFLLKPMQRLVKYPLLLKVDLRDKGGLDESMKEDLTAGIEASSRVLREANEAVDHELRREAREDLENRVDDWKNHQIDHFGDLLLHGQFMVVTGKSDIQKEVRPQSLRTLRNLASVRPFKTLDFMRKAQGGRVHSFWETSEKLLVPVDTQDGSNDQRQRSTANLYSQTSIYFNEYNGVNPQTTEPFVAFKFANELGLFGPFYQQYTIYLFERILLCCKEMNPNKSKDKLMGTQKDKKDKKNKEPNKNAKLQLKGRIFMTNVTDVVSQAKSGSYAIQIFWKGDPGVENFIIRFSNEDTMKKWYNGVHDQRTAHVNSVQMGGSPDAPPTDFAWMRDQTAAMPNPYAQQEDDEEEDEYPGSNMMYGNQPMPRNASSTSLRSRSTTGDSSQSLAGIARAPPPRFPMSLTNPPLSLQTQISSGMASPGTRGGDSYFSPVAESPASSRTSTASSMFPFPRQGTPQGSWEEHNRYTAPAMPRAPSRGSQTPMDAYQMNGRTPQRPSLPAMALNSQASVSQQRSRSYSTPDINAQNTRRLPNGGPGGQVPAVPGIPAHLHPAYDAGIARSQNNSPNGLPMRTSTQSPGAQRDRMAQSTQFANGPPQYARSNTTQVPMNGADSRTMSPPLGSAASSDGDNLPTQLKVKVNCDGNYVTLVVAFNITYQSLIDRIDAKVGRFSNNAIARGTMRLRYRDEDGDFVTIESDDDIQIAFQEWREAQKAQYHAGQLGEIELFCLSVDN
ncbi:Rho guanine nucleotide exchange factor scd1 [Lachnellula suecica]|uniref:Rho guanine nucleotide exchange factor scd1 n=1 Tax=Lachnellula suecica TaxID=602035 RepID=A0A8T9BUT4_9HELO|nr:Rho guanine nucleotide exchange factor scd1 [Lachnellula suecica]